MCEPLTSFHSLDRIYKIRMCSYFMQGWARSLLLICVFRSADGKPENAFAFSGEAKNKKYATEIVHECHEAWRRLVTGESPAKTPSYDLSM